MSFDARRVARALGATIEPHDFGGTSQHDFDLLLPGGRTGALEITSFGADDRRVFAGRLKKSEALFRAPSLGAKWLVIVDNAPKQVRELQPDLERLLGLLENRGAHARKST